MGKQEKIVSMFDKISTKYDLANRVLSMGIDKSWRNKACNLAFDFYGEKNIEKIVDVACGTGDMIGFWQKNSKKNSIKINNITGVDPSVGMISVAKKKFPNTQFIVTNASQTPFENSSVDIISISYGVRNIVKRKEAFDEFSRILKKNGLLVISEFTKNEQKSLMYYLTNFYMNKMLPFIGGIITKNKEAYTYLPNSIDLFLTKENLCKELSSSKLKPIYTNSFSMNISTLIIAKKT